MTLYQVLPRLWGRGKFSDWDVETFAYLKTLGVTHVWLTGIPRHATGADFVKGDPGSPYSVCDWYDVNPYLSDKPSGRIEEFRQLVQRAHAEGLKIITDFIPNHVARNYSGPLKLKPWCDYDWTDTLKVDYSQRATWDEMLRVLRFWTEIGVDGFRCDMAELVPLEFLSWLISSVKAEKPDTVFIAEAYLRENYRPFAECAGFDLLYDKSGEYDTLRRIAAGADVAQLRSNWQFLGDLQPRMLNFLENHDEVRLPAPSFAALGAASLFNRASFMIYFGGEIGENAAGSENSRTSIFNWERIPSIERLVRHIHGEEALSSFEKSTLERYTAAMQLSTRVRDWDNYDLSWCNGGRIYPFLRFDGDCCLLIVCNFSDEPADCLLRIPEDARRLSGTPLGWAEISVKADDFACIELPVDKSEKIG